MTPPMPPRWLHRSDARGSASARLFCFPFAGGGASAYRTWARDLPGTIEVCAVQLPGREERHAEPPFTRLTALVPVLALQLRPLLDRPFAFYGHSMGALIAFELARELRRSGGPTPLALFPAAYRAPHLPLPRRAFHLLPDGELIDELRSFQRTPAAVFENRELADFFLPTLRADFELCDTYRATLDEPLDCPIIAYGGLTDRSVPPDELEPWRLHGRRSFALHMLPGDHFFLQTDRQALLSSLRRELGGRMSGPASDLDSPP